MSMFRENIFNAALAEVCLTREEFAKKLGITPSTLWRKIQRSGDFSRLEIEKCTSIFGYEKTMSIFFAR